MKWWAGLLILLLVLLQYKLWFGSGSIPEVVRLEQKLETQKQENAKLRERNRALEAEVVDLKTGLAAIEERSRSELGMIREGETFYRIIDRRSGDAFSSSQSSSLSE